MKLCIGFLLAIIAWILFIIGWGMWSVISAIAFYAVSLLLIRVYLGKKLVQYSPVYWFTAVFLPITIATFFASLVGFLPRLFMAASFVRIVITTVLCELVFLSLIWFIVLSEEERKFVLNKFGKLVGRRPFDNR